MYTNVFFHDLNTKYFHACLTDIHQHTHTHTQTHTLTHTPAICYVIVVSKASAIQLFLRHVATQPTPPGSCSAVRCVCVQKCMPDMIHVVALFHAHATIVDTQQHAHTQQQIKPWSTVALTSSASLHLQAREPSFLRNSGPDGEWGVCTIDVRECEGLDLQSAATRRF